MDRKSALVIDEHGRIVEAPDDVSQEAYEVAMLCISRGAVTGIADGIPWRRAPREQKLFGTIGQRARQGRARRA